MADDVPTRDTRSDVDDWRGGTDKSILRTIVNVTPGLRIVIREALRIAERARQD